MRPSIAHYCSELSESVGSGWNRFWYSPSDALPLGVLRIGVAAVALFLHVTLTSDLATFYAAGGLLDKAEIQDLRSPVTRVVCFLDYLQSPAELWAGHAIAGAILLLFLVGLYSRITAVLALYVTLCYMHRGPMIVGQAEVILAMLMLYLCLGPCGRCLSVDAWLARRRAKSSAVLAANPSSWGANVSLRLLQIHVSLVYLMMALAKLKGGDYGPVWWTGDAMWFLIAKPESRLVDLTFLHAHPFLVNLWTHGVLAFELAFGLLIWHRLWRPLLLAASLPMWGSMALVTGDIPFCLAMTIAGIAFVPSATLRHWFTRGATGEPASVSESPEIERPAAMSTR